VGVILLNPRIMEYDLAPITLPLALVAWRAFARGRRFGSTIALMAGYFAIINTLAALSPHGLDNPPRKVTAGFVLAASFAAGAWILRLQIRDAENTLDTTAES
jgi:hypothetical protein